MSYPFEPGFRNTDTSKAAAMQVKAKAPAMLARLVALFAEGPASPEQLHEKLARRGEKELLTSVRARVSQLHKQGRVVDSGQRGIGESGTAKVIVWRLATPEELASFKARILTAKRLGVGDV